MSSDRIKVLILIASLRTGGKENITLAIFNQLDRQRFDPLLCVMKDGELLEQVQGRFFANLARFRGDFLGFAWRLFQIMRRERPHILYCLSYRVPGWVGRGLAKCLGVPLVIYELHGVETAGERHLDWLDRHLFERLTDHMIAIGRDFQQALLQEGIAPAKITVIPNGVDAERFYPVADKASLKKSLLGIEAPLIGCISNLRPVKNLPLLLEAFALALAEIPNAQLVIVGEGAERAALEALIQHKNLAQQVHLLGKRTDIPALLNCFDVFALTSSSEASPLVILEAGACGVPVVATQVGELAEMVIEGKTGFLVSSQAALVDRFCQLLQAPTLRQQMGAAAREHVVANFSITKSVQAREALFLKLLEATYG